MLMNVRGRIKAGGSLLIIIALCVCEQIRSGYLCKKNEALFVCFAII